MRGKIARAHEDAFRDALAAQLDACVKAYRKGGSVTVAASEAQQGLVRAVSALYREAFLTTAKRTYDEILKRKTKDGAEVIAWEKLATDFIAREGVRHVVAITDATVGLIQTVIKRGVVEGLGIPDIAKAIRQDVGEINTTTRAVRIARTETIGASNYGALSGAEATGLPLVKNWLATSDPRTRPSHIAAHGQQIGMRDTFTVGGASLRFPGDPQGPPEEVINCRCAVTFEVTE